MNKNESKTNKVKESPDMFRDSPMDTTMSEMSHSKCERQRRTRARHLTKQVRLRAPTLLL